MLPKFQISNFKFQIIPILFLLFSIFYILPSSAPSFAEASAGEHANTALQASNYPPPNTNADVPNNLHNWTQSVMIEVMSALTCQLAGVDPISPKQSCLGADQQTGKIGFAERSQAPDGTWRSPAPNGAGGAIGFMGNMITTLYTPPLHTTDYFKDLASNFGITKKTYAQTTETGFDSLTPLIGIWSAFRNIVYLFLVIIFVVIGLAIMLRVRIDPRTVMTIQNQIPKIIIGILAVTFSFAIAGFLIDMMWVFIYLIYNIISQTADVGTFNPINMQGSNVFGALGAGNIFSIIGKSSAAIGIFIGSAFGIDGNIFGKILGALGVGITTSIAFIIIGIALLVALFRLWFTLLMAYVQILLAVVLAPFWIIGGIVPGSPISLGGWIRDISANLLAFPITIAMFMLGKVFMDVFGKSPATGQNFVPPLIGNPGDPSLIGSLIGLGIILMTPNVVNLLKAALKAPKTDLGIGKALAPGLAVPGRTVSGVGGLAFGSAYETGFLDKTGKDAQGRPTVERSALGKALRLFRGR